MGRQSLRGPHLVVAGPLADPGASAGGLATCDMEFSLSFQSGQWLAPSLQWVVSMRILPIALLGFSLVGCAVQPGGSGTGVLGPGGKADDYYSPTSLEYVVEGRTSITLEDSYADATFEEQEVRVRELIGLKHFAMSYFLTQYLTEKYRRDPGAGWGGFGGMARAGSYRDMDIEYVNGLTWEFSEKSGQYIEAPESALRP